MQNEYKMNGADAQLINLLGALSLALADAQTDAVQESAGIGTGGCAALVAIGQDPTLTIKEIAAIAGLSHSVIVRTIDTLVSAGLVAKQIGSDKREVIPMLTAQGLQLRQAILKSRAEVLGAAIMSLAAEQRDMLRGIVSAMLVGMTTGRTQSDHMCRLCDEEACGPDCPVELEALRLGR
ncbi:MAG: MarR family transcriptional regulator [Hyphomicrobium sp.]|jgi:DNA-binding MarR family transcriptional regulator